MIDAVHQMIQYQCFGSAIFVTRRIHDSQTKIIGLPLAGVTKSITYLRHSHSAHTQYDQYHYLYNSDLAQKRYGQNH